MDVPILRSAAARADNLATYVAFPITDNSLPEDGIGGTAACSGDGALGSFCGSRNFERVSVVGLGHLRVHGSSVVRVGDEADVLVSELLSA